MTERNKKAQRPEWCHHHEKETGLCMIVKKVETQCVLTHTAPGNICSSFRAAGKTRGRKPKKK